MSNVALFLIQPPGKVGVVDTCCVVAKSCLTLVTSWTFPPGSFVHGILQARILEGVAVSFSRGSS